MANTNTQIARELLRRQVGVLRLGASEARKAIALLDVTDADIVSRIAKMSEGMSRTLLETRLVEIRKLNVAAHNRLGRFLRQDLLDLAKNEQSFTVNLFDDVVPLDVTWTAVSTEQLSALVSEESFAGRLLDEWVGSLEAERFTLMRDAIRVGVTEGQGVPGIITRIVGTAGKRYKDSILDISRRHAEAVVRTSMNHMANQARSALYQANSDIIEGVQWLATLDDRTTDICEELNGETWGIDEEYPTPPAHVNCRSTLIPLLKSYQDLGLDPNDPEATDDIEQLDGGDVADDLGADGEGD